MAISLTSFNPNTKIESASVNTNFINLKNAAEAASNRAFGWQIIGTLATGNEQNVKWIVPQNVTVQKLWAYTTSGTCDIRIQKDTTDIHSGFSVSSTVSSTTSFNATVITAGQILTLDITAISSGIDLFVMLETAVTANV